MKLNVQRVAVLGIYFIFAGLNSAAKPADPQLTIRSAAKTIAYSRSALLSRHDLEKIVLDDIPTYPGKRIEYWAVPLFHLFEGIRLDSEATVQFRCTDGFSAPVNPTRILDHASGSSVAYIAIEKPTEPWPAVHPDQSPSTAGPFFLIWKNPSLSRIEKEEWPYQLEGFEVGGSLRETFPKIFPPKSFSEQSSVARGFRTFQRSCFTCHKINEQGLSDFGPDLNLPQSPTEYYSETALRTFIRNPQKLRRWKNDKMLGFSPQELSETDLSDLIEYLKAMSKSRNDSK